MLKKIIILDRDGTLNLDQKGYTHKIEEYFLLSGVKHGLKLLQSMGFEFYILTSQSGIGRGMFTQDDYEKFVNHLVKDLESEGIKIQGAFFCPHHAKHGQGSYKTDCNCRKPKSGLVEMVDSQFGPFDYENSWAIGDKLRDIEMAKNFNNLIKGILLPKNAGTEFEKKIQDQDKEKVDYTADSFLQAVKIIAQAEKAKKLKQF
ncbi:MAG: HAD-IIIA family hydrolase [bacterium]